MIKLKTKKEYSKISEFILTQFKAFESIKNIDIEILNSNKKEKSIAKFISNDIDGYVKIKIFQNIKRLVELHPNSYTNIIDISKKYLNYIIDENSLENNDALFIYILLHEFGHLHYRCIYKYKFGIGEDQIRKNRTYAMAQFYRTTNDKDNIKIYKNHYYYDELYANNFANKHFPRIWYKLKENKFIK